MGVTIRWLKGVTQPSRLTCRAYSADIPPAGSLPCSRCTQGMSWRRPATPLSCRGDQALAAGSETRRRSVDGRVCLRNSPRPGESRSHLSGSPSANVGLVPPAWQWHLGGEVVNKHLSIGSWDSVPALVPSPRSRLSAGPTSVFPFTSSPPPQLAAEECFPNPSHHGCAFPLRWLFPRRAWICNGSAPARGWTAYPWSQHQLWASWDSVPALVPSPRSRLSAGPTSAFPFTSSPPPPPPHLQPFFAAGSVGRRPLCRTRSSSMPALVLTLLPSPYTPAVRALPLQMALWCPRASWLHPLHALLLQGLPLGQRQAVHPFFIPILRPSSLCPPSPGPCCSPHCCLSVLTSPSWSCSNYDFLVGCPSSLGAACA